MWKEPRRTTTNPIDRLLRLFQPLLRGLNEWKWQYQLKHVDDVHKANSSNLLYLILGTSMQPP